MAPSASNKPLCILKQKSRDQLHRHDTVSAIPMSGATVACRANASIAEAGAEVLNNPAIRPGTAIATFVKGRYPNHPTGNHAAFFLRHGVDGFWVIDQYKGRPLLQSRFISTKRLTSSGAFIDPSNNARAFSVIEAP